MSEAIIAISNLSFAYRHQPVLRSINLNVATGSVVGVVGPNGGGKTTLIKLMLGLLEPTEGSIRIGGLSPRQAVRRGDLIGYLPQRLPIPRNFPISVRQLVTLGLAGRLGVLRSPSRADRLHIEQLIDRVGMRESIDESVCELSGGQLQRAFIARALAPNPSVLVLDEPMTGIDSTGQKQFIAFLQGLRREMDLTVVIVSHDLRAVTSLSDRIACLNLTLHYHDVPEHLPADLVYSMFSCDLLALGIDSNACAGHNHLIAPAVQLPS